VRRSGADDLVATRKGRRRRFVLKFSVEYGIWPARDPNSAFEDHDRRRRCLYVARAFSLAAVHHWYEFGVAIRRAGTARGNSDRDSNADASVCSGCRAGVGGANAFACAIEREVAFGDLSNEGSATNEHRSKLRFIYL
jgi:hypothetical protein